MSTPTVTPVPGQRAPSSARLPLPVPAQHCPREGVDDWTSLAVCRGADPDALFVQGAEQQQAKQVCLRCPVRTECLADALDNRVEFGVWGGMTERERRALLRRRPNVTSWRRLLEAARSEHEQRARQDARLGAVG
jgi:WhiB family redox-sensing transcriptional regulator